VFLDVIDHWCIEHGIEVELDDQGVEIVNPLGKVDVAADEDAAAA
jgi:hypothetical protein